MTCITLPINMNNVTIGHKQQGMSKDWLVVVAWSLLQNWIYVVLSCVRLLNGLFLLKPMPGYCLDKFQVPPDLQAFESRRYSLQEATRTARQRDIDILENSY